MKPALRVAAIVCVAACPALAQAPFPGAVHVNGGWVPCDHPIATTAGKSCGTPSPSPAVALGLIDCARVNAYSDPAAALSCVLSRLPDPQAPLPIFQVGRRYSGPYPSQQMIVLGITRSIEGVEVVTFQWIGEMHTGDVSACRNDGGLTSAACGIWRQH